MRVRKNVKNLSNHEKKAFVDAAVALKHWPRLLHPGWAHERPAFFP